MAKVSAEEFVRAWQTAKSLSEVAEVLKVRKTSATMRAVHFRRKGIPLKRFDRGFMGGPPLDIKSLKALAISLNGKENS